MSKKMRTNVVAVMVCGFAALMLLPLTTAQEKTQAPTKKSATAVTSAPSKAATKPTQSAKPVTAKNASDQPDETVKSNDEAPTKSSNAMKATKSNKTVAESAKGSGNTLRLPKYFSGIVDQEQREAIYAVQLEYRTKIAELEEELARTRQDELSALEELLTDSQRKLLAKKRTQAQNSAKAQAAEAVSEAADNAQ